MGKIITILLLVNILIKNINTSNVSVTTVSSPRNLVQVPNWILNNLCSEISQYSFPDSNPKIITRISNNKNDESYLMFKLPNFYDFSSNTAPTNLIWQVVPKNVENGGIFFGMCVFDGSNAPTNCVNITNDIYFSGIAITYFGDNCYHIDHYVNKIYWTTPRHCLSLYELYSMIFTFQIKYDASSQNLIELKVTYDGFEYYDRSNIIVQQDSTKSPVKNLPFVYPCTYMFAQNTAIEVREYSTYPPDN